MQSAKTVAKRHFSFDGFGFGTTIVFVPLPAICTTVETGDVPRKDSWVEFFFLNNKYY